VRGRNRIGLSAIGFFIVRHAPSTVIGLDIIETPRE